MGHRLRRKIGGALFLRGFLATFGAAAFAAGAAVLAIRILPGFASPVLPWGIAAAAFAVSAVCGAVFAGKHLPSLRKLLVWLDGAGGSGGVLASSLEVAPGAWQKRITLPAAPRVRIGCRRGAAASAAGLLFLAGTLLIPQSRIVPRKQYTLDLTEETAELEPKIAVLEEESLLPKEELSELHAALRELETGNDARNAARSYELLEALARKTNLAGAAAGERIRDEVETLRNLALTLETLSSLPPSQAPPEAAGQLGALLEQFAQGNPALAEMLADAGDASKLDPETMRRLAEAMRTSTGELERKLAKLAGQKLLNARFARPGPGDGKSGSCSSPGTSYSEDLASWLEQNAPGAEALREVCLMPGKGQGQGEPSRGRGDAMLRYIGNTGEFSGKTKDLAVAGANDPERSVVVRRSAAAPNVEAEERRAAAGQLRGGEVEIEQREAPVYPEHRAAVKRYFKTKEP